MKVPFNISGSSKNILTQDELNEGLKKFSLLNMIDKMLINVSGEVKQEDIIKASETKEYYINLNKKNKNKNKNKSSLN